MKDYTITDIKDILTTGQEWQEYNFGHVENWKPALGIIEEMGELSHAILKNAQKIRGYEEGNNEFKLLDAIADATVYLAQYSAQEGLDFPSIKSYSTEPSRTLQGYDTEQELVFAAISEVGGLLNPNTKEAASKRQTRVNCILIMLAAIAQLHHRELNELVVDVWNTTVGPRDWKNYPNNGKPPQEEKYGYYTFDIQMGGFGDTADEAWNQSIEGMCEEPGETPEWTWEDTEE